MMRTISVGCHFSQMSGRNWQEIDFLRVHCLDVALNQLQLLLLMILVLFHHCNRLIVWLAFGTLLLLLLLLLTGCSTLVEHFQVSRFELFHEHFWNIKIVELVKFVVSS